MVDSPAFSQDSIDGDLDLSGGFPSWPSQAAALQPEVHNVASGITTNGCMSLEVPDASLQTDTPSNGTGQLGTPGTPAVNTGPNVLQSIQNVEANTHPISQAAGSHPQLVVHPSDSATPSGHKRKQGLIVRMSLVPNPSPKSHLVQGLVHAAMLDLMGVTKGRNADGNQSFVLLDPLRVGESPRKAPDGTRLWNPDWRQDSTFLVNSAYLGAVADLILDHEKVNTRNAIISTTDILS